LSRRTRDEVVTGERDGHHTMSSDMQMPSNPAPSSSLLGRSTFPRSLRCRPLVAGIVGGIAFTGCGDRGLTRVWWVGRRRPLHGKLTVALLGASMVLNAMLVLYIINLSFMRPLEFDRESELAKFNPAPPPIASDLVRHAPRMLLEAGASPWKPLNKQRWIGN
jgi:hypothetical protein